MRDIGLLAFILAMLPLAAARPFVGILMWSWVSFMNPHRLAWGFISSMPLAAMAFGVTLLGCVMAREPKRLPINAVTVLLVVLLACITATSSVALAPPETVWAKWDYVSKIILGLLLTAALLTDRRRIHAFIWLMAIALAFFGVKGGVFTLLTGGSFIVLGPEDSIIGDRNHLSVALLVCLPLMNYLRLHSAHRSVRWVLVAAMAFTLLSVVGSQSRGALIALAATSAVLWLRTSGKLVSGIVIGAAVAGAVTFMPPSWTERMWSIETYEEDASAMGRVRIWQAGLAIALDRPFTGGGFKAVYQQDIVDRYLPDVRARADHSIWIEALSEHGFPTFAVWLGVILAGAFYAFRVVALAQDRPDLRWAYDLARMAQVSMVAYVTGGTFLSLAYWDYFWALMVVMAATHALVAQAVRAPAQRIAIATALAAPRGAVALPAPVAR
ncbi:putative O-glycosylation ligase, exosortase A system-associated [Roseomonas sp. CAU 1739]|uniref:putative O-glycosylation ligase, exosortase A system-associated n=1 Tax=Roseomonas sp. CAU 1739 TaxID=3140364 RepID=UPI00325A6921